MEIMNFDGLLLHVEGSDKNKDPNKDLKPKKTFLLWSMNFGDRGFTETWWVAVICANKRYSSPLCNPCYSSVPVYVMSILTCPQT